MRELRSSKNSRPWVVAQLTHHLLMKRLLAKMENSDKAEKGQAGKIQQDAAALDRIAGWRKAANFINILPEEKIDPDVLKLLDLTVGAAMKETPAISGDVGDLLMSWLVAGSNGQGQVYDTIKNALDVFKSRYSQASAQINVRSAGELGTENQPENHGGDTKTIPSKSELLQSAFNDVLNLGERTELFEELPPGEEEPEAQSETKAEINEETYQKAKPRFTQDWQQYRDYGFDIDDFEYDIIFHLGEKARPYLDRWKKEVYDVQEQQHIPAMDNRIPENALPENQKAKELYIKATGHPPGPSLLHVLELMLWVILDKEGEPYSDINPDVADLLGDWSLADQSAVWKLLKYNPETGEPEILISPEENDPEKAAFELIDMAWSSWVVRRADEQLAGFSPDSIK